MIFLYRVYSYSFVSIFVTFCINCALSGLRQFLASENPLKMMENGFYFTLEVIFVLKMFKFLSWFFDHVEKWLD